MRIGLPSRPKRKLLVSLIPEIASFVIAAIFAHIGSDISLNIILPVLSGAILFALVAEYYATFKPIIKVKRTELSTFFKRYLNLSERQLNSIIAGDADVRVNIMLLKSRGHIEIFGKKFLRFFAGKYLQVEYVADKDDYTPDELDLEFDVGQGCCGRVIEKNDQFVAVSPEHTRAWDTGWETTEKQDHVTSDLNVIVGTPIYRPSDEDKNNPIGVLVVDSEDELRDLFDIDEGTELSEFNFKETRVAKKAIEHARNVGILL